MNSINLKKVYFITISIIILLGILLRILLFAEIRPFWIDECMLALNIIYNNDYFHMLYCDQAAPAFFMYISKFISHLPPDNFLEIKLRIFPFICSVLSIFVFYKFSANFLKKTYTIILATALMSFLYRLIQYSQEFKQYSCDVLVFMLVLYSYFLLEKTQNKYLIIALAIGYSLIVYISFPAVFALCAVFMTLLIFNRQQFKRVFYILIPIFISIVIFYINYKISITSPFLKKYWIQGFFSLDFISNKKVIEHLSKYLFNSQIPVLFFALGLITAIKNEFKNKNIFLLLSTLFIVCSAAFLYIYPLAERVALYLCPIIIIFMVKFIDYINIKNKILYVCLLTIITFFTLYSTFERDYDYVIQKKYYDENLITPLSLAMKMAKPEDIFIISQGNKWIYVYLRRYINVKNTVIIEPRFDDENVRLKYLQKYPKGHVYYLVSAHGKKKINSVRKWAKKKKDFYYFNDGKENVLIRFRL